MSKVDRKSKNPITNVSGPEKRVRRAYGWSRYIHHTLGVAGIAGGILFATAGDRAAHPYSVEEFVNRMEGIGVFAVSAFIGSDIRRYAAQSGLSAVARNHTYRFKTFDLASYKPGPIAGFALVSQTLGAGGAEMVTAAANGDNFFPLSHLQLGTFGAAAVLLAAGEHLAIHFSDKNELGTIHNKLNFGPGTAPAPPKSR